MSPGFISASACMSVRHGHPGLGQTAVSGRWDQESKGDPDVKRPRAVMGEAQDMVHLVECLPSMKLWVPSPALN